MEHSMEFLSLLLGTITLRPYVFVFLAVFLFSASKLIGWRRTAYFWGITYIVSLLCELISTRTGIPFGWYHYNGSTIGRELYVSDIPAMNAISFPFILFASYCMALAFLLPATGTNGLGCCWLSLAPSLSFSRPQAPSERRRTFACPIGDCARTARLRTLLRYIDLQSRHDLLD